MRKIIASSILAISLISCQDNVKGFVIRGSIQDSSMNGQLVKLYNVYGDDKPVDSSYVKNGAFLMNVAIDTLAVYKLSLNGLQTLIIGANEEIEVRMDQIPLVTSKGVNGYYGNFMKEMMSLQIDHNARKDSLFRLCGNNSDSLQVLFAIENQRAMDHYETLENKSLSENRTNMFGAFLVGIKADAISLKELDSLLVLVPLAENIKPVLKAREKKMKAAVTSVGHKFVDFTGTNLEGHEVLLSDYVGRGNYVLVNFWASWCGPNKKEIPYLKELYKYYKGKGLVVLGINVYDKKESFNKALDEDGIEWEQIYASDNNAATESYGINAIPHIMLFDQNGIIKYRDLRGEDMKQKIESLFRIK